MTTDLYTTRYLATHRMRLHIREAVNAGTLGPRPELHAELARLGVKMRIGPQTVTGLALILAEETDLYLQRDHIEARGRGWETASDDIVEAASWEIHTRLVELSRILEDTAHHGDASALLAAHRRGSKS